MKESYIQEKVCKFAESLGWEVRKMGTRDDPDRLFYRHSVVIFIEFKATKNGRISQGQIDEHKLMRRHKMNMHIVNSIGHGKQIFKERE